MPMPQMQAMHDHMQAMQEQMARIHAATDPEARRR
jgi:DNA-binding protein YbaB